MSENSTTSLSEWLQPLVQDAALDDAPLLAILKKDISKMSDVELDQELEKIRATRLAPQTMRAMLSEEEANLTAAQAGKPRVKKTTSVNASVKAANILSSLPDF